MFYHLQPGLVFWDGWDRTLDSRINAGNLGVSKFLVTYGKPKNRCAVALTQLDAKKKVKMINSFVLCTG